MSDDGVTREELEQADRERAENAERLRKAADAALDAANKVATEPGRRAEPTGDPPTGPKL